MKKPKKPKSGQKRQKSGPYPWDLTHDLFYSTLNPLHIQRAKGRIDV